MKSILYFVKSKEPLIPIEEKESIARKEEQAINCNEAQKKLASKDTRSTHKDETRTLIRNDKAHSIS